MKTSTCQNCHTVFNVTPGSYGKFCSLSCSTSFRNKSKLEKDKNNYKINPSKCKCCEIALNYEKRNNKYCSISCASKITNSVPRKRGPTASVKYPYSTIKFLLCNYTNQYYSNRNRDGSIRRCSPYIKTIKEKYYSDCRFKFNVYHYPEEFDLFLIEKYGWYTCPGLKRKGHPKNLGGVSRDHIISINHGFINNIDPYIISHPANCQIMLHSENKIKDNKSNLTLDQLLSKINLWNIKYNERRIGLEPMTSNVEG